MRRRFNLDLSDLDRYTMLWHGNYGVGKTHLLGDMLREESKKGKVAYLNIVGQDGMLTIRNFGLGEVGYEADTLNDLKAVLEDVKKEGVVAVGLDGMKQVGQLVIKSVCGDKLPSVGKGSDDWQRIHRDFEALVASFRHVAPIFVATSDSDRSMDQITGETSLTPDLPGRQAAGIGGQFDFVFLMRAQATGPTTTKRTIQCAPIANTVIRARLPKPLPASLDIPEGAGGWAVIKRAISACLTKGD